MRAGERTLGPSSLRVSVPMSVPPHMRPHLREITHVQTDLDMRNKGHATLLLLGVCVEADRDGTTLMLAPAPEGEGGLDADALAQWYSRRFGFWPLQHEPALVMIRLPGEVQPTGRLTPTPVAQGIAKLSEGGTRG
jgi:hypothetical protein